MSDCPFCGNVLYSDNDPCPHCKYWTNCWATMYGKFLPMKCEPFIIEKNSFEFKNQKHNYQDIKHIHYETLLTRTTVTGFRFSDRETAKMAIYLENGTVIKDRTADRSYFPADINLSSKPNLSNLRSVYLYISEASFSFRFARYAKEINAQGYFSYDGARFFTDGHIETRNQQRVSLQDYTIENYSTFFQLTPRNPSLLSKIGKGLSNLPTNSALWKKRFHGHLTIQTTMDRDVFYSLMLRIYTIKFPFTNATG